MTHIGRRLANNYADTNSRRIIDLTGIAVISTSSSNSTNAD
jgi:hypothetical protein